jgi:AraC family transcriptional regulator
VFGFVQRVRLERAAVALIHHPDESVLAVALDHGFGSAATFARAFRGHFGMSATAWRGGGARFRKHGKANRKPGKAMSPGRRHGAPRTPEEDAMKVELREFPRYHVAYMRYVGPYGPHGIPELWKRFGEWIEKRAPRGADSIALGIGLDDPDVTPPEKCRYDACLVVPESFAGDKWVNVTDVPGGRYAVAEFVGTPDTIRQAWDALYRSWLPGSGYEPDDRPCLEVYRGKPQVSGKPGAFRCELCVPVRPL